eukprot:CAMPEP_0174299608 /NCGR_PEP_ID=MMETSP0809-20121228/57185_1 /TAXON_ID=73025 ORGANISM="Eutreptiella gymnastica-like, Strain CCMP1594" /NCGR_SAMPLE_ID=MMETSP0809 /ASSEMBLY_ACC=CAM_ASM_000658 /LENGTH=73 /DNA_ID=CAMNT_0015404909 /DNA_START=570 /DNA_END=791 /DNA_ORIENTATION=+
MTGDEYEPTCSLSSIDGLFKQQAPGPRPGPGDTLNIGASEMCLADLRLLGPLVSWGLVGGKPKKRSMFAVSGG